MALDDPDDRPIGYCGHVECARSTDGCLRISSQHVQPTMWTCPVSLCRRPMLTVERNGRRTSYEVVNANAILVDGSTKPILAPHACGGFSRC